MLRGLISRVNATDTSLIIQRVFAEHAHDFADENRQQLLYGFNSVGKRFRKYKSAQYAAKKYQQNPLPGLFNPDLRLRGGFHEGLEVQIEGEVIRYILTDPKSVFLKANYDDITGLYGPFKEELINDILRPDVIKNIRKGFRL